MRQSVSEEVTAVKLRNSQGLCKYRGSVDAGASGLAFHAGAWNEFP